MDALTLVAGLRSFNPQVVPAPGTLDPKVYPALPHKVPCDDVLLRLALVPVSWAALLVDVDVLACMGLRFEYYKELLLAFRV